MTDTQDGATVKTPTEALRAHMLSLVAQRAGVATDAETADVLRVLSTDAGVTVLLSLVADGRQALCPACGVRVAGSGGLCAECSHEAMRLSGESQRALFGAENDQVPTQGAQVTPDELPRLLRETHGHLNAAQLAMWGAVKRAEYLDTVDAGELRTLETDIERVTAEVYDLAYRAGAPMTPTQDGDAEDGVCVTSELLDAHTAHIEAYARDGATILTADMPTDGAGVVRLYLAASCTVEVLRGENHWTQEA